MNATLKINRTYHERYGSYFWGASLAPFELGIGVHNVPAMTALELGLDRSISKLIALQETGVDLTVELPEGVTLTDAYKTQVTTKYTADGILSSITFA